MPATSSPELLIVDISGSEDPVARSMRLSEMCDPSTAVIAIGDRNDVALYRDLRAAGVTEYFFKPLVGAVFNRGIGAIIGGGPARARTGKLVVVLGVRGGVGATTIAASAAWHVANERGRRSVMLDLDLQAGDAALLFATEPGRALRQALDRPDGIDEQLLKRSTVAVSDRLGLLAALEPLAERVALEETAITQLIGKLAAEYRYVFIDLPREVALRAPRLLHLPGVLLLVNTGSLSAVRDWLRWRETIGSSTPQHSVLLVLNKRGAEETLPEEELRRVLGQEPDISIAYSAEIAVAAKRGVAAMQQCRAMREGMTALARHLTGDRAEAVEALRDRVPG